jgi:hypothetical protein
MTASNPAYGRSGSERTDGACRVASGRLTLVQTVHPAPAPRRSLVVRD